MQLVSAGLSEDPLDPRFRALWQAAGNPHILSPVYGGYTANAEFEALCGFPVIADAVFFESRLRRGCTLSLTAVIQQLPAEAPTRNQNGAQMSTAG